MMPYLNYLTTQTINTHYLIPTMTHIIDHSDSEDDVHEEDYVQTFTHVQNKL